jgi:hypothetical protein
MNKCAIEIAQKNLAALIVGLITSDPFERGGLQWAKVNQEPLAEHIGVSVKTLHRWMNKPPFQREVAKVNGVKVTLLRLVKAGEALAKTPQHVANIMRKVWAEKVGTELDGRQHGCLIGLAKEWPEGHQLAIFKCVLNHWGDYMAAAKHAMEHATVVLGVELTSEKGDSYYLRYYKFPNLPHMRRFHVIGVALYAMKLQAAGKPVPPSVNAIYESLEAFGGSGPAHVIIPALPMPALTDAINCKMSETLCLLK